MIYLNQFPNFLHLIYMTRKIKYIIGMIWGQFRKKKIKRRLFERIRKKSSVELETGTPGFTFFLRRDSCTKDIDLQKELDRYLFDYKIIKRGSNW